MLDFLIKLHNTSTKGTDPVLKVKVVTPNIDFIVLCMKESLLHRSSLHVPNTFAQYYIVSVSPCQVADTIAFAGEIY